MTDSRPNPRPGDAVTTLPDPRSDPRSEALSPQPLARSSEQERAWANTWREWQATDIATLCFIVRDHQVLLIRKKRGLGAGKINGPGGKVDPGETAIECAVRETREELLIEPTGLERAGRLLFQFKGGYGIDVTVFHGSGFNGVPTETDEAIPLWYPLDALPFDEMWQDDELWFPLLLARQSFLGHFLFEGDQMVDYHLELE